MHTFEDGFDHMDDIFIKLGLFALHHDFPRVSN